jgi:hypothetical protein
MNQTSRRCASYWVKSSDFGEILHGNAVYKLIRVLINMSIISQQGFVTEVFIQPSKFPKMASPAISLLFKDVRNTF